METNEHKQVGDQIRIETLNNPYLQGSENLSMEAANNLIVRMMQTKDGVPVPLDLHLSAGDVVAMAGDYYTKAGWGLQLKLPERTPDVIADNKKLFTLTVEQKEKIAFREAYDDLASPQVSRKDIDRIYEIESTDYIPFFKSLNGLVQQAVFAREVSGYGDKLNKNESHFALWSGRAYIVGHHSALHMAQLARFCRQLAAEEIDADKDYLPEKFRANLAAIRKEPEKYHFDLAIVANEEAFYTELGHRYHALAVGRDLFAMHFYSDHFAGGHLSRIGLLRQVAPKEFGVWGSILINNMHNEDNTASVKVTIPFQPVKEIPEDDVFIYPTEDTKAFGDGTYFKEGNDENANLLINGMMNSLGDITRLMQDGDQRSPENYGGLAFLPEIDYTKRQPQPLLLHSLDGKVYFRKEAFTIKMLSPEDYKAMQENPGKNGYEQLTYFKAVILVLKLRTFGLFISPKLENPSEPTSSKSSKETTDSPSTLSTLFTRGNKPRPRIIRDEGHYSHPLGQGIVGDECQSVDEKYQTGQKI
mgnify:CR=1 FL=1